MAKNRAHEEVTESDTSSEFHVCKVSFLRRAGRERRWRRRGRRRERKRRTVIPRSKRLLTCLRSSTTNESMWKPLTRARSWSVLHRTSTSRQLHIFIVKFLIISFIRKWFDRSRKINLILRVSSCRNLFTFYSSCL